jgi:hypothetical protein
MLDKILLYLITVCLSVCVAAVAAAVRRRRCVAAAPKRKVSFGAEMSPAKVVVGWHGSGAD